MGLLIRTKPSEGCKGLGSDPGLFQAFPLDSIFIFHRKSVEVLGGGRERFYKRENGKDWT